MGLEEAFSERGVPLRYPLQDLTDHAELSVDSVWDKDERPFRHILDRYGVEDILLGRFSQLSSGQWIGEWIYRDSEKEISRYVDPADARQIFSSGADLVAKTMATRFSVKSLGNDDRSGPILRVVGIEEFRDYIVLVSWLEALEVIEQANLERIVDNIMELRLISVASKADLSKIIDLNSHLISVRSTDNFDKLTYRWETRSQKSP
jgi:hypothetical protein